MEIRSGALSELLDKLNALARYSCGAEDLAHAKTLLLASDYGGEHAAARYRSYTFVLVDQVSYAYWKVDQERWRERYLPDGRRLSYKGLGDVQKRRALTPFLALANSLRGVILTLLVNRNLPPLVEMQRDAQPVDQEQSGRTDDEHKLASASLRWRADVWNKVLTIATTVGVMLSAFSHEGQHLVWISDDDAIAPNEAGLRDFITVAGYVIGGLIPHGLGHVRMGAASVTDDGSKSFEDLTALADLVSGALSEEFTRYGDAGVSFSADLVLPVPSASPYKAREIMNWYSESRRRFERHAFLVDPGAEYPVLDKIVLRTLCFHGTDSL